MDLDTLLVITYLLLTIVSSCHGNNDDNCTTYPSFTNYSRYSTGYHCYLYPLPPPYYGDPVEMTVSLSEDDATLIWYTDEGEIITCDTFDQNYHCTNDNKTLTWRHADIDEEKIFYVNATNSCGGNATACFKVKPSCSCDIGCLTIPSTTNSTVYITEHSEHEFEFTIRGDVSVVLQWCLGPDNHSDCCICSDNEDCQVKDWTVKKYYDDCIHYTCLLTIHDISMNYSDVTLISRATSDDDRRIVNYTRISVTQDSDNHKSLPTEVLYGIVIGVGVGVVVIVMVICVVYMIKRRSHSSKSYYVQEDYEPIPSSDDAVLQRNTSREMDDDFGSNDNVSVRSCDLGNHDIQTPIAKSV